MTDEVRFEDHPAYGNSIGFTEDERSVIKQAMIILDNHIRDSEVLSDPNRVRAYLRLKTAGLEHEVFGVLFLDNRHRVIDVQHMFRGTIDGAAVPVREVVKETLKQNAAAVILFHNHPSGVAEPSRSDRNITDRLRDALLLVDVRVLDHFVVGDDVVSFAERGWI